MMPRSATNLARHDLAVLSMAAIAFFAGAGVLLADDTATGAEAEAAEAFFAETLTPLLKEYCLGCHSGDEPEAQISLDAYTDTESMRADRETWQRVARALGDGIMPPEDEPRPEKEQLDSVVAWVTPELDRVDCSGGVDPGRVTIRRLNRAEYNNTIRDLTGLDLSPADDFPSDDVGYGFDNMADVLSLPPILLEKYLAAAEAVAQAAIVVPVTTGRTSTPLNLATLETTGTAPMQRDARVLISNGAIHIDRSFPATAKYAIGVVAFGQQAGAEAARMEVRLDDEVVETFDVAATADDPGAYEVTVSIAEGVHRLAFAFTNDYQDPDAENATQRDRNLIIESIDLDGPIDAAPRPLTDAHRRIVFNAASDTPAEERAREILERFATRAFRRPIDAETLDRLVALVELASDGGDSFERGIQLAIQAMLVSPRFLFRLELDPPDVEPNSVYELDAYDLAARLSYFLWSTMPDEALFAAAADGSLKDPAVCDAEIRRMLADGKASALVDNFAMQWLQLRNLDTANPDRERFPTFDDQLRAAMRRETELYVETIIREDRDLLELIDSQYTYVNARLASHYGIDGVEGDAFRRVSVDPVQRGGVLTQASVLTVTSNPTRTSPVKRGRWVLEQILGTPPPPAPGDVEPLDESPELTGTLRQRFEQHRADASCASCHKLLDPPGFGLENYDAVGAWRTSEGDLPVDASGEMADGETFEGSAGLRRILLAKKELFLRAISEKMLIYALGRGLKYHDRCAVDEIAAAVSDDPQHRFSTLVLAIANNDAFKKRRARGAPDE